MAKRRNPPRTVKGKDIELLESDGRAVDTRSQVPFTPRQPAKDTEGTLGRLMGRTPFRKVAKVLRGE